MEQEYIVEVSGEIAPYGLRKLNHGLHYGGRALPPCKVSWQNEIRLRFALKGVQGGQLRDMCAQVGLNALAIRRIRTGRVLVASMPAGPRHNRPAGARFYAGPGRRSPWAKLRGPANPRHVHRGTPGG